MGEEKKSLKDLFVESTVVQGLVTLTLVITVCYQAVSGQDISEVVAGSLGIVMGFWFRSKAG